MKKIIISLLALGCLVACTKKTPLEQYKDLTNSTIEQMKTATPEGVDSLINEYVTQSYALLMENRVCPLSTVCTWKISPLMFTFSLETSTGVGIKPCPKALALPHKESNAINITPRCLIILFLRSYFQCWSQSFRMIEDHTHSSQISCR